MTAARMRRQPLSAMPKADGAAEVRRVKSRGGGAAPANARHRAMHDRTRVMAMPPQYDYIKWNERREALRPTSSWGSNTWPSSATECGSGRCSNNSTSSHVQRHCLHGPQNCLETHATELCRRHRFSRASTSAISPSAALLLRQRRRAVCDVIRQRRTLAGHGRCRRRRCGIGIDQDWLCRGGGQSLK